MSSFSSDLMNIEQLFLNNDGGEDKGKNYFIPIYQRDFVWGKEDIEKLIIDINTIMVERDSSKYNEYFIGGIVLCRESLLGEERSSLSLEVIDGQQRLTSLSIILSFLIQYLKYRNKEFGSKESFVDTYRVKFDNLIKYKKTNNITHEVREMFKIERSDDLSDLYEKTINHLLTNTIEDFTVLEDYMVKDEKSLLFERQEEFINLVKHVESLFSKFTEDQLIGFTIQLLEYTKLVVTKTQDIDTGFLVFEKLNDNGKKLNPDNLLKNFLFSKATRHEYEKLEGDWNIFLEEIHNINERGSKVSPREFLENYLIIKGKNSSSNKDKIFKIFKDEIYDKEKNTSLSLLTKLKKTVAEYSILKRDEIIFSPLKLLGFKLGYLLFLALHKKLIDNKYEEFKYEILVEVFKLGFCYILTDNSKLLSQKVPEICKEISESKEDSSEKILSEFKMLIKNALEIVEEEFNDTLINTNMFGRRKSLTINLFNIINFHENGYKFSENALKLVQIVPRPDRLDDFDINQIEGLTFDYINKYTSLLGNLTLSKFTPELNELSVKNRLLQIEESKSNFFFPCIAHNNLLLKSKDDIENRSKYFAKLAYSLFYESKLSIDYFTYSNLNYFFIERSPEKNAFMILKSENEYIIQKGSKSNLKHHDSWSYNRLKEELISNNIMQRQDDCLVFTENYSFESASASASIVLGKQAPGPKDWKNINGVTLKELLDL